VATGRHIWILFFSCFLLANAFLVRQSDRTNDNILAKENLNFIFAQEEVLNSTELKP
jgi:hypothetical protein